LLARITAQVFGGAKDLKPGHFFGYDVTATEPPSDEKLERKIVGALKAIAAATGKRKK